MNRSTSRLCVVCLLFAFLLFGPFTARAAWLDGWLYRAPVTVNNSGSLLSDYTVNVYLDASNIPFTHAKPDGADLRITDSDGTSLLPFWVETWDPVAESADAWTKVPEIPAGSKTLYAYYGNASAQAESDGAETFLFYDGFEEEYVRMNAPEPLETPSYDGSGQMVHPDVLYIPEGWGSPNSYTYWMAVTPYPWGNDDYENPSVLVSEDGIQWDVPPGLTNPLVPNPPDGHHCDTDVVRVGDELFVYYMLGGTSVHTSFLQLMRSSDGVNWSGPTTVLTHPDYLVSPTFLDLEGQVHCWYVASAGCSASSSTVHRRSSTDGIGWGAEQDVSMSLPGQVIWHVDIQQTPDGYAMVCAAYPEDASCGATSLYFAESTDGLVWSVDPRPLLTPNPFGWDNSCIYRSTFLKEDETLSIWYSSRNTDGSWHVGYTEGTLNAFWEQQHSVWDSGRGELAFTTDHARSGDYGLETTGGTVSPQLFKNLSGAYCANMWIYDDLAVTPSLMALLRLWDNGTPTYPLHAIGVGIWQGSSETHYTTHTEGWSYTPTTLERTEGWHRVSLCNRTTFCDLLVDGTWVRSLDVLDEQDIKGISIDSYHGGTTWFDDVHVHPMADPEPEVVAGQEQNPPWTAGAANTLSTNGSGRRGSLGANWALCLLVPLLLLPMLRRRLEKKVV